MSLGWIPPRTEVEDRRGRIAAGIWGYSAVCGVALGAGGALITLIAFAIGEGSAGFMIYAGYAELLGATFGLLVGLVVGLTLGLIVAVSPHRLRAEIMIVAIPVVALAVSLTPIALVAHGQAVALFGVLDLVLTVAGAAWLLGRYNALEVRYGGHRVH